MADRASGKRGGVRGVHRCLLHGRRHSGAEPVSRTVKLRCWLFGHLTEVPWGNKLGFCIRKGCGNEITEWPDSPAESMSEKEKLNADPSAW